MIYLLPVIVAAAAFLTLALSMKRHQRDLAGRNLSAGESTLARISGWMLLALAWLLNAVLLGLAMGTIVWLGEASLGGWLTVAALHWRTAR